MTLSLAPLPVIDPPNIMETTELVERIKTLRQEMGLSQRKFADRFGLSWETLKNWESRRRQPDGPTILLLELILLDPEAVHRMVNRVLTERGRRRFGLVPSVLSKSSVAA